VPMECTRIPCVIGAREHFCLCASVRPTLVLAESIGARQHFNSPMIVTLLRIKNSFCQNCKLTAFQLTYDRYTFANKK
jgi:hypothetical protein